jgi:hypothetical protein
MLSRMISGSKIRSYSLLAVLAGVGCFPLVTNCSNTEEAVGDEASDDITGVNNALGLGLRYDETEGRVYASLKQNLKAGEKLFIRVRQGKLTHVSQKNLKCSDLTEVSPIVQTGVSKTGAKGNTLYKGPVVGKNVIDLLTVYEDARWQSNNIPAELTNAVKNGSDPIVEACILSESGKVQAKLQTNLAYAWDQSTFEGDLTTNAKRVGIRAGDAGVGGDGGGAADATPTEGGEGPPSRIEEGTRRGSNIEYGELCVQDLGEIPFFPKISKGKYETFDCRDYVASKGEGATPHKVAGVESAIIPVRRNGVEVTTCDPGVESFGGYDCMQDTDEGMYLAQGGVQPGPTVHTAVNEKGTHWVLLCRKISDDGNGMMKSKRFNDMAMLGHNPKNGKTCFFQNSIGSGTDGAHVPHPADQEKSTNVWDSSHQGYCSSSCHGADAFVHSRWIDGALRANGKPIVPKMGEHIDFPISQNDRPYYVVNMDAQGISIPKELISPEADACLGCHRMAGNSMMGDFTRWSLGRGDQYMNERSAKGKEFAHSHWMPIRLQGLTEANFETSEFNKAAKFIEACANGSGTGCEWGDIPRGPGNRPLPANPQ